MPANSASTWAVPITPASRTSSVSSRRPPSGSTPSLMARARTSARFRTRSPRVRITPLLIRKTAAASGLAKTVRSVCSRRTPVRPAGMVATTNSQPRRSSEVSIRRRRAERTRPRTMRTHSRRKNTTSANAVATWRPTRKARKNDSGRACARARACQRPPSRLGRSTECPRLETGNSSVTPCSSPITIAWK